MTSRRRPRQLAGDHLAQQPPKKTRNHSTGRGAKAGFHSVKGALLLLLFLPVVVLLLPLILLGIGMWLAHAAALLTTIWLTWCARGINVLLITSDSPNWHDYIETRIRPRLPDSTVVLNWSKRSLWNPFSLRVRAFYFFGGSREFNPQVIVFRGLGWPRCFRFWRAFRDYKHGNLKALEVVERDLFNYLERIGFGGVRQDPA